MLKKCIKHFLVIMKHRHYVRKLCFKCGYYKRGLLHDLSKFSLIEFFTSAKYFQGNRSPIEAEKEACGYSIAWQHHKGHNPHHWEYWIDRLGTYENVPIKIPYEYVVEMVCDWISAGIVYNKLKINFDEPFKEPLKYHNKCKSERLLHPDTKKLVNLFLKWVDKKGIDYFCHRVRKNKIIKSYYEETK